jgi:hypothetical protein
MILYPQNTMPDTFAIEKFAFKMLLRILVGAVLLAAVAYPLDWAVWRVRVAHGGGMGSVQVELFTIAELKGGKEDYYPNGTATVPCSRSIYPQGGNGSCWWLERHWEVDQHY